jgi:V-type H+-transporting ATPase subunit C
VQSNVLIEGLALKIRKQIEDLERDRNAGSGTLAVDGVPVDSYLSRSVQRYIGFPVRSCVSA